MTPTSNGVWRVGGRVPGRSSAASGERRVVGAGTAADIYVAPAACGGRARELRTILSWERGSEGGLVGLDRAGCPVVRVRSEHEGVRDHPMAARIPLLDWTHVRVMWSAGEVAVTVGDATVRHPSSGSGTWTVAVARPLEADLEAVAFVGVTSDLVFADPSEPPTSAPVTDPAVTWGLAIEDLPPDPDRPRWHFMPPTGWMNEPHGVLHRGGRHHLFYQRNELGPYWGSITWGHAVSDDLMTWTDLGSALAPRDVPSAPDGIWSGSSATDADGHPWLFFTAGDDRDTPNQRTVVARPEDSDDPDLRRWTATGPPVTRAQDAEAGLAARGLTMLPGQFRDPFVWHEAGRWFQLVGAGIAGAGGTALLFTAPEPLGPWTFHSPLMVGDVRLHPETGVMWELPSLVPVGGRHILLVTPWWPHPVEHSLQYQWYWIGDWNPVTGVFSPDGGPRSLDIGGYLTGATPSRHPDGRLLLWSITQDLLPEREHLRRGWAGSAGVPLEVGLDQGRLTLCPVREVVGLRDEAVELRPAADGTVLLDVGPRWDLDSVVSLPAESSLTLDLRTDSARAGQPRAGTSIVLSRTSSEALVEVAVNGPAVRGVRVGTAAVDADEELRFRVLVDHSVVEVFVADTLCATTRAWSDEGCGELGRISRAGGAGLVSSALWPLREAPPISKREASDPRSR